MTVSTITQRDRLADELDKLRRQRNEQQRETPGPCA